MRGNRRFTLVPSLSVSTSSQTGSAPLHVLTRTDPTRYGKSATYNGHNIFWDLSQTRNQAQTFLWSQHRSSS